MSEGNEHNGRRRELTICKITIPLMCECHVRYEPLLIPLQTYQKDNTAIVCYNMKKMLIESS